MRAAKVRAELDAMYPGHWALGLLRVNGKRPIGRGWTAEASARYADAPCRDTHLDLIAQHVAAGGNVGWMPPSGVVALDADDEQALAWLRRAGADAPLQETGRGAHAVFAVQEDPTNTTKLEVGNGVTVDVRGTGAQIVVSPSVHPSGARYAWKRPLPVDLANLPPCPVELPTKGRRASRPKKTARLANGGAISEGARNSTLASLAGSMRRRGLEVEAIEAALLLHNRTHCDPPLPDKEVRAIASSIGKYDAEPDHALEARLAGMRESQYQREREAIAGQERLGLGALDKIRHEAVRDYGFKTEEPPAAIGRTMPEPCPEKVSGPRLAREIECALRRFVALDENAYPLVVAWVVGSYMHECRGLWPLLLIRSPQPNCGKSTLLDVLERLVPRAFVTADPSPAVLFRSAGSGPTQLLDELDGWVDRAPEIIGFLRAGWQVGRPFVRVNPETLELEEFPAYCPKALAVKGDVRDDAVRSRCLVVEMRRALPGERPERFRARADYPELVELQARALRLARDRAEVFASFKLAAGEMPELANRAADNAEAILAAAGAIGGMWPRKVRTALLRFRAEEAEDLGAMLLADLRDWLAERDAKAEAGDPLVPSAKFAGTAEIVGHLRGLADRPWDSLRAGVGIDVNWLRRTLAPFGIKPTKRRPRRGGDQVRGYDLAPIREAAERYLTPQKPEKMSGGPRAIE